MRKWSKFLMFFVVGVLGIALGFSFKEPSQASTPPPEEVLTTSTSLTTQSEIFREIKSDGMASYLEIKIPENSTSIKGIKITQTIGSFANTLTEDETGTTCYYTNSLGSAKATTFYFTRPATYTVQYITGNNSSIISESCTFAPEINHGVIENLSTTGGAIAVAPNYYVFTAAGTLELPQDSHGLYEVSAFVKYQEIDDDKLVTKYNLNATYLNSIPDDSFGTVTYKIKSVNGNTFLNQDIVILTTDFNIEFSNGSTPLNKADFLYNGGYVFNSAVNFTITVKDGSINILDLAELTDEEKVEIMRYLDFYIRCDERDTTNTSIKNTSTLPLEKLNNALNITHSLENVDHTVYTILTNVAGATKNATYDNAVQKFKIITKVPQNDQGNYLFSLVLEQVPNARTNNYLDGILNGYLYTGTTIYYPTNQVRLYYNGYTNSSSQLVYNNGSKAYLPQGELKDFSNNNSTITVNNTTLAFNDFYIFSFKIQSYTNTNNFIDTMLRNQMKYNGSNILTDDFSDCENSLSFQINSFSYTIPSNYATQCIPLHVRVTYNGTCFEDIYEFSANDELRFTSYGNYSIEFYNLPSYEFLMNNINGISSTYYYYKLDFVIAGPSIFATTTDRDGHQLTLSNHMYTQNPASVDVNINPGQQLVVYKNGNEYARRDASMSFDLTDVGTWKISIVDSENNQLRSLIFTIADRLYQGFSINNQDEYEKLWVGVRTSTMPVIYTQMEEDSAYHLTYAGTYKIEIDAKQNLLFTINGADKSTFTVNTNAIVVTIQKSYFALLFNNGPSGSRTSEKIIVSTVGGVELQTLEVYRNNKLVKTFSPKDLADWDTVVEGNRTFADNGTYTFRLVDKFGNTYEAQMEKYYKVNVALVFLILIALAGLIILISTIIKARHRIKVK